VRGATTLTFTRSRPDAPTKLVSFNAPVELHAYLKEAGKALPRGYTDLIIRGIELDRDLGELLKPHEARIEAFAQSQGIAIADEPARVIAMLVEMGLQSAEQGKKKGR
jgi:hypothetical protein